jgi:hypothetical protein
MVSKGRTERDGLGLFGLCGVKWLDGQQRQNLKGWSGVVWFVWGEMAGWSAKGGLKGMVWGCLVCVE